MPEARRSTRSALPPSSNPQHINSTGSSVSASSSSSLSSALRKTRSTDKHSGSPLSSEGGEAPETEPLQRRSSKRAKTVEEAAPEFDDDGTEVVEGADITRCVCGQLDYPGPPLTEDTKARADISEETGGLFIQCDKCSVWQHGGCVGIMDEDKTPDDYFCELCDKRLHQVRTDPRGQRYSRYLPVVQADHKALRKPSVSRESEPRTKKERDQVSRGSAEAPKRRSTMNSRQTYDEEEMLRKAIEESRGEGDSVAGSRKAKRSREESEEEPLEIKRQRKGSESNDAHSTLNTGSLGDSDDEGHTSRSALKKIRAAAAETIREKERREREKAREQQRVEAAKGRQQRAGRRRADESEPVDETPKPEPTPAPISERAPSPPVIELNPPSSSHKKGGKKTKRLGRNQYTRDRDLSPTRKTSQVASASSSDETRAPATTNGHHTSNAKTSPKDSGGEVAGIEKGKGKGRWKKSAKGAATADTSESKKELTLKDMDRATTYMLDFIGKNLPEPSKAVAGNVTPWGQPPMLTSVGSGLGHGNSTGSSIAVGMSSLEIAETLKKKIEEFRSLYASDKDRRLAPGGLTV